MSYKRSRANFETDQPQNQQPPFVFYGTALPPLDSETRDDGSYVPLWKQEVKDERGRKRLHGAFTGGFSAGYFNTVGSKEGWTPSTFVSSRSNRAKDAAAQSKQRNEDFMDEEDLADLQESQKLSTQSGFAGLGSTEDDGLRQGFMTDLFRTSGDTMGVKLLQRMGWRRGQGIGPKRRRQARGDEDGDGVNEEMHLFAPDDSRMISIQRKKDRFGLGFTKGERLGTGVGTKSSTNTQMVDDADGDDDEETNAFGRKPIRAKTKVKKSGLGIGVLNDTGSDDEDPYEIGPKISYNRIIGGDKKKPKMGLTTSTVKRPASRSVFLSQKLTKGSSTTNFRRCHDGRLPIDGFVLASAPLIEDQENNYPPPQVPPGWQSSRQEPQPMPSARNQESTADLARASTLDPSQRAALLGETALPGKSIFDYLTPSVRDKLASLSNRPDLPQAKSEAPPAGSISNPQIALYSEIPYLDARTAQAALDRGVAGWMPYAEDLSKRERYTVYLESMAGTRAAAPTRKQGMSKDEWGAEMREFVQAARVFKGVSGVMASRFTSASSAPELASDAPDRRGKDVAEEHRRLKDPAEEAAILGMFGHLTRSRVDFYPSRLTCKRFGVRPPAHVVTDPGQGPGDGGMGSENRNRDSRLDVVGKEAMDRMMAEMGDRGRAEAAASRTASEKIGHVIDGANTAADDVVGAQSSIIQPSPKAGVVDVERNEALEGQRAGEELFKSIFGDDDDD